MSKTRWVLDTAAALLLLGAVLQFYYPHASTATVPPVVTTAPVLARLPIDFSKAPRTLLLVIQRGCSYCDESMEFYRRLISLRDAKKSSVQIIMVAPPSDGDLREYLAGRGVKPDQFVSAGATTIPVTMSPTVLLADQHAEILRRWEGYLNDDSQADVMSSIHSDAP